ncbi:ammonia monooxygenase [Thalassospira xiamenensis]|uniref:Ammonia monooxygenase n=1 Tax=Thalassospira xiamenensis TaxID=220697 RepID=A0ABR5Y5D3_9PROT|nr:ammonia monooxygenase [Thalassospira xiamenensis]KZD07554.1 ammonia monooxygenase [Thalassospira xiamenensis]
MIFRRWLLQGLGLLLALAGGSLFNLLGVPIGWVLGALIASAVWSNATGIAATSPLGRRIGQVLLGSATAAILTPELLSQMAVVLPLMLLAAILANAVGLALTSPFARIANVDRLTAILSVLPAGLAEMSGLAKELGARSDIVVISHTIRVSLIVFTLPMLAGSSSPLPLPTGGSVYATVVCVVGGFGLAWLVNRFGMLNPWIVVPVMVGLIFSLIGYRIAPLPPEFLVVAQVLIGASLGTRLSLESISRMPRILLAASLSTFTLFFALAIMIGPILHWFYDVDCLTAVLAIAPGGLGEMLAAAKAVGANVSLVLGFHLLRSLLTNTAAPLIIKFSTRVPPS